MMFTHSRIDIDDCVAEEVVKLYNSLDRGRGGPCAGTYYFIRVRDYALDSTGVSNAYNNDVKTLYSLP